MCGIVAVLAQEAVAPLILDSLKRLEYRGYDSAGIAVLENGMIRRCRASGKLHNLKDKLEKEPLSGYIGIGHTRWATHGKPTEINAHPHATKRVAVVHNGIIENFQEIKESLKKQDILFESETDTEVIVRLVDKYLSDGLSPQAAVMKALPQLRGAFALVFLFAEEDNLLIGARHGAPLAVGSHDKDRFLGSDALALAPFTDEIIYLDDGDCAILTRETVTIHDFSGRIVERPAVRVNTGAFIADKGSFRHFMAKEIHEQPEVIGRTFAHYVDFAEGCIRFPKDLPVSFESVSRLTISACGTAYYAGLVARYWFEHYARLPVDIDVASEFRYREPPLDRNGLALFISQSGETADTLASLRYAKEQKIPSLSVVNVETSTIARESDACLLTLAGPEIGVASTKAFTCQLSLLLCLAVLAGRQRGFLSEEDEKQLVQSFISLPGKMSEILKTEPDIEKLARKISKAQNVLYLGRGTSYPLSLEGALKLKEISYIHAEGYAAGELKHGPIALIEEDVPVIVIAPYDHLYEKTVSNMQEVAARGGQVILITDRKGKELSPFEPIATILIPESHGLIAPLLVALPIQLLAYHVAIVLGKDVDQPRNLAKSVTVE